MKEHTKFIKSLILVGSLSLLIGCSPSNVTPDPIIPDDTVEKTPDTISDLFTLNYGNESSIKNSSEGALIINKTDKFSSDVAKLVVSWGDKDSAFTNYSSIKDFTEMNASDFEVDFTANSLIPMDATKIWVEAFDSSNKSLSKGCVGVEEFKQIQTLKYEFQVISDQQVSVGTSAFYNRTVKTFEDIKEISPNSKVIVSNGDIVDEGKAANYDSFNGAFTGVFGENSFQKQLIGIGNHEFIIQSEDGNEASQNNAITSQRFTDRLNLWKEKTGNESQYFYEEIEGSYFIFLGTTEIPHTLSGNTRADCTLGDTQLNWLKDTMINAGKTNKPIYLFSHGSLRDTVSGSLSKLNQTWYGYTEDEEAKLRDIIKEYPQTLFFSSHSHWSFESEQPYLIGNDYPSFFNTAAIGYLWEGEGSGRHYNDKDYNNGGAQGLYIDVYDKQVVIKGRQFEATDDARSTYWCSCYQVVLPL